MALPKLLDDHYCFGCGSDNPQGLKLSFELDSKKQRITTQWTPAKVHQGYQDVVHGGMLGLVLDELMVNLPWKLHGPSVSAEFTVRLLQPSKVGELIQCEAWVVSCKGKLMNVESVAKTQDGTILARAQARCVLTKI